MKKFVTGFTTNFDGVTFGSADEGAKTVIVSTIAAGSFGAVYGFVPEVREKVDEKITQIIYDTVGPGRLHQIPAGQTCVILKRIKWCVLTGQQMLKVIM